MSQNEYREKCLAQKINVCHTCGTSEGSLVVHHIDGDPANNDLDNLVPMCKSCHSSLHTSKKLTGHMKRLQDKLPEAALSYGKGAGVRASSGNSTARIPVSSDTLGLVKERKRDGQTFDDYLRVLMGVEDSVEGARR